MNLKWYYSTFIIILTLLGVGQQQNTVPNQEIVVQFTNADTIETHITIAAVKEQLQSLGVQNIQVEEDEKGKVTISYFSSIDVAGIKQILSENNLYVNLPDSNIPLNKEDSKTFDLDIYEIRAHQANAIDLDVCIIETKTESDRILNPNVLVFYEHDELKQKAVLYKEKGIFKTIAIAIDNTSHKIPEVRAGPLS